MYSTSFSTCSYKNAHESRLLYIRQALAIRLYGEMKKLHLMYT